ncbi:hypothetical protein QBC47DRAFT_369358 [Echria macrotheca]|uniref:Uncharacterized protein n=1 Tax=Echria macrotheca TaxID=438768 RepID=A0AAJ0BNE8_9PEZI|nr:hypothetical protein QBC47DRAFT_369358 [Echria macrotheca]
MLIEKRSLDSDFTKKCCVAGLVVSWVVGAASLVTGTVYLVLAETSPVSPVSSPHVDLSHTWREVLPLVLNVVVTVLNDSMGYIHTCTLRWSLQREGKLEFNSNLRLLTASRDSRPNGMLANLTHIFGIVLSYGSTSLIFLSLNPDLARVLGKPKSVTDTVTSMHINPAALLTLGLGILLQAIIATWAIKKTHIPSWSSNPLDVVRACVHDEQSGHRLEPRVGRCMMGVDLAKQDAEARRPDPRQKPIFRAHSRVRYILFLLCAVPVLSMVWGGVVLEYIKQGQKNGVLGRSWALLPVFTGMTDANCSVDHCTDGTSVLNVGWSASNGMAGTLGGVLVVAAFQSAVSLSLHCAELIVNLSRDEEIFRELIGPRGTNGRYNSITAALKSWQTLFLFALKAGVHWIFGLAINLQYRLGVNMYPPQVFYLAGFALLTFAFALYLSLRRPRGFLPASYGHLQTMADIIDEWADSGCMFWGEKFAGDDVTPGYTGTSTGRLREPRETQLYGGPQVPIMSSPYLQPPTTQSQRHASHNSLFSDLSGYSSGSKQSQAPLLSGHVHY